MYLSFKRVQWDLNFAGGWGLPALSQDIFDGAGMRDGKIMSLTSYRKF